MTRPPPPPAAAALIQDGTGIFRMNDKTIDLAALLVVLLVFWLGVLRQVELPGLYMDAVNPDYIAAQVLHPELDNPVWKLPTVLFPILGSYYHGVQNFYVDLVVFKILGISVTSVRIAQAVFGAAIVGLLYCASLLVTGSRLVSFLSAVLLASDIAFLASFRTQFYIILGGEAWLFASLLALWSGRSPGYFLSGLCFGLAIYGYFVLGFFAPALAVFVLSRPERRIGPWIAGFVLGLLPYVVGYGSFALAVGGIPQAVDAVRQAFGGLAPLSSKLSAWDSLQYVVQTAGLAITDGGNELMIFGDAVSGRWGGLKIWLFVGVFGLALVRLRHRPALFLTVLLPVSYLAVAAIFGNRLWVHHFSVLVPMAYLLLAVTAGDLVRGRWAGAAAIAVTAVLLAGNLRQADHFHDRLDQSGGTGKASNALTRLAEDALSEPGTLYVFPEWGFFTSFNLLTENRVGFVLDTSQIDRSACRCQRVAIAFWSAADTRKYVSALSEKGLPRIIHQGGRA